MHWNLYSLDLKWILLYLSHKIYLSAQFGSNLSLTFWDILCTDRQTDGDSHRRRHYEMRHGVCLSVCPPVCLSRASRFCYTLYHAYTRTIYADCGEFPWSKVNGGITKTVVVSGHNNFLKIALFLGDWRCFFTELSGCRLTDQPEFWCKPVTLDTRTNRVTAKNPQSSLLMSASRSEGEFCVKHVCLSQTVYTIICSITSRPTIP